MALRVRRDGRMFCAALCEAETGDTYIPDPLHYQMSAVDRVIVTEPMPEHTARAEWWWRGSVPEGVMIDSFYEGECDE